jgi:valyl-tRNA synthetase
MFMLTYILQLLHPFMPIVTEEIYHQLKERTHDLTIKPTSNIQHPSSNVLEQGKLLQQVITTLREARAKNHLKPKEKY